MDVSVGLLIIIFGVSCLAVKMGAFIGVIFDGQPSALLHGHIQTQCFLVADRLRKVVVALQEPAEIYRILIRYKLIGQSYELNSI